MLTSLEALDTLWLSLVKVSIRSHLCAWETGSELYSQGSFCHHNMPGANAFGSQSCGWEPDLGARRTLRQDSDVPRMTERSGCPDP